MKMCLIAKENKEVIAKYGAKIRLNLSQVWKVVRTEACKPGEYALFKKDDNGKFSLFGGYVSYSNICDWFEMIKA